MNRDPDIYFHINTGLRFARPYESTYATLRRCLSVNPGISIHLISANLREQGLNGSNTVERFITLQNKTDFIPGNYNIASPVERYRRQCPICVCQLYHTGIYALPWLLRCPIHHCLLTDECPRCHQAWPKIEDLTKRDCPTCGILSLNRINRAFIKDIETQDYQVIADLYEIIYSKVENQQTVRLLTNWLRPVPVESMRYPSYKIQNHPKYTSKTLRACHIPVYNLHCKTTRLIPKAPLKENRVIAYQRGKLLEEINYTPEKNKAEYSVARRIVAWIAQNVPKGHKIHINSYRYMDLCGWLDSPKPCPYCMAFSLWFYHVASLRYNGYIQEFIHQYPFLKELGVNNFISFDELSIEYDFKHYALDDDFMTWLYCRGLEVSFIYIQLFVHFLFNQVNLIEKYKLFRPTHYFRCHISDWLYHAYLVNDKLYFHYENEHPLDVFTPAEFHFMDYSPAIYRLTGKLPKYRVISNKEPRINNSCELYQSRNLLFASDRNTRADMVIKNIDLTADTYFSAQRNFKKYLRYAFRHKYI